MYGLMGSLGVAMVVLWSSVSVEADPGDAFVADAQRMFASPSLQLLVLGLAAGGLATSVDDTFLRESSNGKFREKIFTVINNYGSTRKTLGTGFVLWTVARWKKYTVLRALSSDVLRSIGLTGLVVTPLKVATRRRRPDRSNRLSFPSGHTANAFSISTVLARRYGRKVGLPVFSLAAMVPAVRVGRQRHHFSDVVAGAFFGIAAGLAVGLSDRNLPSNYKLTAAIDPPGWKMERRM